MPKFNLRRLIERTLACALAVAFVLPLGLTAVRRLRLGREISMWLDQHWMGIPHLIGETDPINNVPFSWHSLATGQFQKCQALGFDNALGGREAFARYTNELWFRLFRCPGSPSSFIVVGKNDVLFGKDYLQEYFLQRGSPAVIEPWIKDLRRLQDFCLGYGMGFAVVLTPSKVSIYPEDTPTDWQRWYDPQPRGSVLLRDLFRKNGIVFVDAVELTAREKMKDLAAPLFPKGGIHWNPRAALPAANEIQTRFAEQNIPAKPIDLLASTITNTPQGEEGDFLDLMNLARRWSYPCERLTVQPRPGHLTMAIISDSFGFALMKLFDESGQFSEIGFHFYYKGFKNRIINHVATTRAPAIPLDFAREIFGADCLLLELNEASANSADHYLSEFIRDALAHLPDPQAPKTRFSAD